MWQVRVWLKTVYENEPVYFRETFTGEDLIEVEDEYCEFIYGLMEEGYLITREKTVYKEN